MNTFAAMKQSRNIDVIKSFNPIQNVHSKSLMKELVRMLSKLSVPGGKDTVSCE